MCCRTALHVVVLVRIDLARLVVLVLLVTDVFLEKEDVDLEEEEDVVVNVVRCNASNQALVHKPPTMVRWG